MVCIKIPTLQNEMEVFLSLTFRYLTCLLDKGHITDRGGYFCGLLVSLPNVYPAQKQVIISIYLR